MFLRKLLLIVAAIAGVAIAFAPTGAFARGGRGGGGRGGGGRGFSRGRGFVRGGIGLGLVGAGIVGASCWRTVAVATPYGPRYRRVWVCD
jgi:hypothetical protein